MARKDILRYQLESNKSLASAFTSPVTVVKNLDNVTYQIIITTSDSIGTFDVEVSNDYQVNEANVVSNPGNWISLALGTPGPNANAADDDILISLNQVAFTAIRVSYTPSTPGTGTCSMLIIGKQLGG